MRWLRRTFRVLHLPEAVVRLKSGTLPSRAACITFDDGYADNVRIALPILQEFGLPATFFVATGFLGGGCMWNDTVVESIRRWPGTTFTMPDISIDSIPIGTLEGRREAVRHTLGRIKYLDPDLREIVCDNIRRSVPDALPQPMMQSRDVKCLAEAGMTLGAHTRSHPILARLPADQARNEIQGSRVDLEEIAEAEVSCFAYPNGKPYEDYTADHVRFVRDAEFRVAVSTVPAAARAESDPLQLPRFTPWDRSSVRYLARLWHMRAGTRRTAPSAVTWRPDPPTHDHDPLEDPDGEAGSR